MKKKLILLSLSTLIIQSSSNNFNIFKTIKGEHQLEQIGQSRTHHDVSSDTNNSQWQRNTIDMTRGDVNEGKEIFIRKLQKACELSAGSFAAMHSQDEWEAIVQAGEFKNEIIKICPKLNKDYNQTWSPSLYQFVYQYANDTGDIPSY